MAKTPTVIALAYHDCENFKSRLPCPFKFEAEINFYQGDKCGVPPNIKIKGWKFAGEATLVIRSQRGGNKGTGK